MAIRKLLIKLLCFLVILTLALNFQCKKKIFGCAETVYNFELGVKAYPDRDSIHIGDTIWFEVNSPDTLRDIVSNELIDYSNVENLGSDISMQKLSNGTFSIKAVNKFQWILRKGTIVSNNNDPALFNDYNFSDIDSYYQFKLGIVPAEAGTYGLIFSNAENVYRRSDKCTKASFGINFVQTNQHYYLNPNYQGGPTPPGGDYYFEVN